MNPGVSQQPAAAQMMREPWLTHTWQLTLWNLRLARRRLMSKILAGILLFLFLVVIAFLLIVLATERAAVGTITNADCSPTVVSTTSATDPDQPATNPCEPVVNVDQQEQEQSLDQGFAQDLTFPNILTTTGGFTTFMGPLLLCILIGAVVGSEYGFGTQRLALSRGVSRAQLIVAQVAATILMALIVAGGMLLLGTLFGVTIGPLVGGVIPNISLIGWGQLLLYGLAVAFNLLAYGLIALLLGTLGRSTAVGIAGALGYIIFEAIAAPILEVLASGFHGEATGATAEVVHHALLGPNLTALINGIISVSPMDQGSSITPPGVSPISAAQGLTVSLLYCIVLVGVSYWLVRVRDVTY